jgi:hypothetical protein
MSSAAHTFLKLVKDAAMSSAVAGLEVMVTAFRTSALRELSVDTHGLCDGLQGSAECVDCAIAMAGGTAGAAAPTVDCE